MSDMNAPELTASETPVLPAAATAEALLESAADSIENVDAVTEPVAEAVEAVAEAAVEPAAEMVEAIAEPVAEAVETVEAAAEAAEAAAEPAAEVVEAIAEPVAEAVETVEAVAEAAAEPTAEVVEAMAEPVAEAQAPAEPPLEIVQRSMSDLNVGMALGAVVKRIALFGAFCDIGIEKDGLLHISQLGRQEVRNVEDVVHIGQALTVYVMRIDAEQGRIALSLVKPVGMPWDHLRIGGQVTGKIIKMETYGVFLDFGAERPGMIHVSELANGYVKSPSDVVQMGDTLTAQIIKIDRKKKRIDLSVKALTEQEEKQAARAVREEQQDEVVPTAMELAMRLAMKSEEEDFGKRSKKGRKDDRRDRRRGNDDYEEIFDRTIRGHRG
jgi:small subunit ribosomal protein S1